MKKNEGTLDAVKTMRTIRDSLSRQFSNMTVEDEKEFIRKRLKAPRKTEQAAKHARVGRL